MNRLGTFLLLAGSAAVVWCLTVLGGAALFDYYEKTRMSRTPAPVRVAPKRYVCGKANAPPASDPRDYGVALYLNRLWSNEQVSRGFLRGCAVRSVQPCEL